MIPGRRKTSENKKRFSLVLYKKMKKMKNNCLGRHVICLKNNIIVWEKNMTFTF